MRILAKSRTIQLQVAAAGMHLSREFGRTIDAIRADGFKVDAEVEMLPKNDTPAAMAESVGRGVVGFTRAFERLKTDIVVVLGDRTEALAAAVAATLSGRILAHIHGGDKAEGGYDDSIRHAITKLAHLHFAATHESRNRIVKMGERKEYVRRVGSPALDEIRVRDLPSAATTKKKHGFPTDKPLILCVQHAIPTSPQTAGTEMDATLSALARLRLPTIVIYPNSDTGGRNIIKVIKSYERKQRTRRGSSAGWLKAYKSLPRDEYLAVMKAASVMVGNSSSGFIEAASFRLRVVNIGRRQTGRPPHNVIQAEHRWRDILQKVRKALAAGKLPFARNAYGDGHASPKIARNLETTALGPKLRRKLITY
jgi:UDP-N-acetylglucosamine 2-epimerase (non-hydrolysing)/GDP/UDP-N,N'-diacetylbacillosamine 2-epimerase (hydrolysing)